MALPQRAEVPQQDAADRALLLEHPLLHHHPGLLATHPVPDMQRCIQAGRQQGRRCRSVHHHGDPERPLDSTAARVGLGGWLAGWLCAVAAARERLPSGRMRVYTSVQANSG